MGNSKLSDSLSRLRTALCAVLFASIGIACSSGPEGPNLYLTVVAAEQELPLESARVLLVEPETGMPQYTLYTNELGVAEAAVRSGEYNVYIQRQAFATLPNSAAQTASISVGSGSPLYHTVTLPSVPGSGSMGAIEVRVISDDGNPVPGALVVALGEENLGQEAPSGYGHTAEDGVALVTNLKAGAYTVAAFRTGARTKQVQSVSVTLEEIGQIDVPVSDGPLGSLKVQFSGLNPDDASASAELLDLDTGQPVPGTHSALIDGSWEIIDVAPGTYLLEVEAHDRVLDPEGYDRESWLQVVVKSGEVVEQTAQLVPSLTIQTPTEGQETQLTPQFTWVSAQDPDFYNIEVRDTFNNVVFGGFALDGTSRFEIDASNNTIVYGALDHAAVDPSYIPSVPLTVGWYRWRVYSAVYDSVGKHGYTITSSSSWKPGRFTVQAEEE